MQLDFFRTVATNRVSCLEAQKFFKAYRCDIQVIGRKITMNTSIINLTISLLFITITLLFTVGKFKFLIYMIV